jgi:outer membrane protein
MKNKILILAFLCLIGLGSNAQLKIGYTNVEYVLSLLPESKQIESELSSYEKQLSSTIQAKITDYQNKLTEYQQNAANYSDVIRADKEKEIMSLETNIQEFQQNAQNSLLQKRDELLAPAFEKIGVAIEDIAKENGYTHILNMSASGQSILLYAREEDNVTNLVLKKLGVNPPANGN